MMNNFVHLETFSIRYYANVDVLDFREIVDPYANFAILRIFYKALLCTFESFFLYKEQKVFWHDEFSNLYGYFYSWLDNF